MIIIDPSNANITCLPQVYCAYITCVITYRAAISVQAGVHDISMYIFVNVGRMR